MKNEGDKLDGDKEANMVSQKSKEDALLLSLESVDDSWVLDFGALFHATPHRGYFIDYVQGDFAIAYWGIMNLVRLLEREKLRLSYRMRIIGYYMR